MKRYAPVAFIILFTLSGLTAGAELCTIDPVPAATLMLPYFEVDLDNPDGVNTIFSVTNASASAALFHVVVWTDLSVPTLDFDVYLTGFDTQSFSLRDIFVEGRIPVTASDGQDPTDTISPQGPISQDINFASCNLQMPPPDPAMNALYISHAQAAHTGNFSPLLGGCAGQALGDNIARGYITIDSVVACSLLFPGDPGYFGGGIPDHRNILFGDYAIVDGLNNFAHGDTLVHIESAQGRTFSGTPQSPFVPGDYTFYGRYVAGTALDQREPLPTITGVRYAVGGVNSDSTDLIVWRDSKRNQNTFTCGTVPSWYPLGETQVVMFDEEENPFVPFDTCTISPCAPTVLVPFPAEANRVAVNAPDLPTPYDSGWVYLNLNTTVGGLFDPFAQSWVTAVTSSQGRFSFGLQAAQFDSACNPSQIILPVGP